MLAAGRRRPAPGISMLVGGVIGLAFALWRVLHLSPGPYQLILAFLLVPVWMFIGIALGAIIHFFLSTTFNIRPARPWEEDVHKVVPRQPERAVVQDPFVIGSLAAILATGGAVLLLLAAIGLVYLPVLLK